MITTILNLGNLVYSSGPVAPKQLAAQAAVNEQKQAQLNKDTTPRTGKGGLNYFAQEFGESISDAFGDRSAQILYAPGMRDSDKETELRHFMMYHGYGNKRDPSKNVQIVRTMVFPLPETIQDETTLEWAAETDKVAKSAATWERIDTRGFFGTFMSKAGDWWSETKAGITGTGGRREKGVTFNTHEEYFFKGVNFRDFSFKHKLIPISPNEAADVKTLVETFKYLSSPSYSESGKYFTYPSEFDIHFLTLQNGKYVTNEHLTRIGRCVLDKVSVNYTSEGSFQSLPGGEPIVTELELSFKELDLVTKETLGKADLAGNLNHTTYAGNFSD